MSSLDACGVASRPSFMLGYPVRWFDVLLPGLDRLGPDSDYESTDSETDEDNELETSGPMCKPSP